MTQVLNRRFAAWLLLAVAVFGLAADCGGEGGWSQEGGDSEPHWRH